MCSEVIMRKVRKSSLQNLHCNDLTVSNGLQNMILTTLQQSVREIHNQGPSRTAYTLLPSAIEQFFQNR